MMAPPTDRIATKSPRLYRAQRLRLVVSAWILVLSACGVSAQPQNLGEGLPKQLQAEDRRADILFQLQGRELTLTVGNNAPASTLRLVRSKNVHIFCGRKDQYAMFGPLADVTASLPAGSRRARVRLSRDISREVGFCGIEGPSEAHGFFIPEAELVRATLRRLANDRAGAGVGVK